MAGETTTYRVQTIFEAKDAASSAMKDIAKHAKEAAHATEGLKATLQGMGAAFVGSKIFHEAKKAIWDYNSEIEQSKTKIAGMLTMFTTADLEKSWDRATVSVDRFQEMARKSTLTTKDLVETSELLARPLLQAGLSMGQVEKMTFGVANASKAFGIRGEVAAMDIEQALSVGVHQRDRFARNLLAQKGVNLSQTQFNALSQDKKVEALEKALTSESITKLAAKQGEGTLVGVQSTLQDTMQIMMSKVGKPLFTAITNEIREWNVWLDKNSMTLEDIGHTVGQDLVRAFDAVKSVFSWIYDHKDTLIEVAKAYAAFAIGSKLIGGAGSSVMGLIGKGTGVGGFFSKGHYVDDEKNGGAKLEGVGAAYSNVTGKLVKENMNLLTSAAAVGAALGTMLYNMDGVSEALAGMRKVGEEYVDTVDQTSRDYANLRGSMNALAYATREATARMHDFSGAGGTPGAANYQGSIDFAQTKASIIQGLIRNGFFESSVSNEMKTRILEGARDKQGNSIFDPTELTRMLGDKRHGAKDLLAELSTGASRQEYNQAGAEYMANQAWARLPDTITKQYDDQKQVMSLLLNEVLQVTPYEIGKNRDFKELTKKQIDEALGHYEGDLKGVKQNQTVNITIQQVSAKDPNRWLADMEDIVRAKTRNRTRSRGAPSGSMG